MSAVLAKSVVAHQPAPAVVRPAALEPIGFARPGAQTRTHHHEIMAAIERVLDSQSYVLGAEVRAFEQEFARFVGTAEAIGVASGTDALHLALRALDIGPGDEVITTAHTAVATIAAIDMTGAAARFVDVSADRYTLDPGQVERAVTARSKAILPVHLYGHPADMGPLALIAERHGLAIVEDCAQAHGASWAGRRVGAIGTIGCFSCYPTKNLGAIGDAGIITTDDATLARRLRGLRQYGWREGAVASEPGFNSRLDELQAAILRVKLPTLLRDNDRRRAIARRYGAALADLPLTLPTVAAACESAWHLYVVRSARRDALKAWLAQRNVLAGIHYAPPAHRQPAYAERYAALRLPVTEQIADEALSLPIYPELRADQIDRVIEAVRSFHRVGTT